MHEAFITASGRELAGSEIEATESSGMFYGDVLCFQEFLFV